MDTLTQEESAAASPAWLGHFQRLKGWIVAVAGAGAVLSGLVGYYTTYKTVAGKPAVSACRHVRRCHREPLVGCRPPVHKPHRRHGPKLCGRWSYRQHHIRPLAYP